MFTKNCKIFYQILLVIIFISSNIYSQEYRFTFNRDEITVLLNDSFTPRKNDSTIVDVKNVKFRDGKYLWGAEIISKDYPSKINDNFNLKINFKEKKYLSTYPFNVRVEVNDTLLGWTPLFINSTNNKIHLTIDDYSSKEILFENINHTPIKLDFTGQLKKEKFVDGTLFKLLLGTSVVLGATAAYYKIKADKEHDKFLDTRNKNYLDDTDKFDLYSGVAFGALQLNFAALIYFLLTD